MPPGQLLSSFSLAKYTLHNDRHGLVVVIPGGDVAFGEALQEAAIRGLLEETGLEARIEYLIDVSESVRPENPWHRITVTFLGRVMGGTLTSEGTPYGEEKPQWFTSEELKQLRYHPIEAVKAAFLTSYL